MSNTIYSTILPTKNSHNKKYNYVYIITELSTNKKYIGVRSCNISPEYDLGKIYFSSSTNKKFIKNQKENPYNYRYNILSIYKNREDAINEEIRLHHLYNVDTNNEYYNKSKSSSNGFDQDGKVVVKDYDGNIHNINKNDPLYLNGDLVHHLKNTVAVLNEHGEKVRISYDEYNSGNYVGHTKNKVIVRDKDGNIKQVDINDPQYLSGELIHICKNKTLVKDKDNNKFFVDINDPRFLSGELVGHTKGYKASEETKRKMSESQKLIKHSPLSEETKRKMADKKSKPLNCEGKTFKNAEEAAKFLNITKRAVRFRCTSNKDTWKDWFYI